ncbi:MAG: helix-turn-helix domain-containing protein [Alphaproteobacteria bacterium]
MAGLQPIRAIERGISVMRALEELGTASLHQLHEYTGLHRTTLLRILLTLEQQELVRRGLGDGLYRNTFGLRRMTGTLDEFDRLAEIAGPVLGRLCERVKWPSDLMVRNGKFMEIKETSRRQTPFLVNRDEVGHQVGFAVTAVGRAYLAFCPRAEYDEILDELARSAHPADQLARTPEKLEPILEQVRAQGYATRDEFYMGGNYGEGKFFDDGLSAISIPVLAGDQVLGCVNLVWMRQAVPADAFVADHLADLRAAADEIVAAYDAG